MMPPAFHRFDRVPDLLALIGGVPVWVEFFFVALVLGVIWFVMAGARGKRCIYCRKRNRPHAVYCAECGHRLDEPPKTVQ